MPWPKIVPSTAVKLELTGVQNLLYRPGCTPFYFRHGSRKVVGIYRRDLWPEPFGDQLFACMWNGSIMPLMWEHREHPVPGVDDKNEGPLDRGYRVRGEKQTFDGREAEDLHRGQLEDAREAISGKSPRALDYYRESMSLLAFGNVRDAIRAAVKATRTGPDELDPVLMLMRCFEVARKSKWAARALERAATISPQHPTVLRLLAEQDMAKGEFHSAAIKIDLAIKTLDYATHRIPEDVFLPLRLVLAMILRDIPKIDATSKRFTELDLAIPTDHVIDQLKKAEELSRLKSDASNGSTPVSAPHYAIA